MKKILAVTLIFVLTMTMLCFVGCSMSDGEAGDKGNVQTDDIGDGGNNTDNDVLKDLDEDMDEDMDSAGNAVRDTVDDAGNAIRDGVNDVGNAIDGTMNGTGSSR